MGGKRSRQVIQETSHVSPVCREIVTPMGRHTTFGGTIDEQREKT